MNLLARPFGGGVEDLSVGINWNNIPHPLLCAVCLSQPAFNGRGSTSSRHSSQFNPTLTLRVSSWTRGVTWCCLTIEPPRATSLTSMKHSLVHSFTTQRLTVSFCFTHLIFQYCICIQQPKVGCTIAAPIFCVLKHYLKPGVSDI